tara:strand:- start:543 stop:899 length:357 start_codon:yes stop_codon:yes gene_type:complete
MRDLISLTKTNWSNIGGRGRVDAKEQLGKAGVTIGKATAAGTQSGGWIGAIVGAIIGSVDAAFGVGTAKKRAKIEEERYRQELIGELFEEKKTNFTPIYIIGGVLLVGGIVTYFALKE